MKTFKIPNTGEELSFDYDDFGKIFILRPINEEIYSYRYWYDDKYEFKGRKGKWVSKDICLMLVDNVPYFVKIGFKIKTFLKENREYLFTLNNFAIQLRIQSTSGFINYDDIKLIKCEELEYGIEEKLKNIGFDAFEHNKIMKQRIRHCIFNVWENDVLVQRSIGEVERIESRKKKLESLNI